MKGFGWILGTLLICFSKVQAEGLKVGSPAPDFSVPASDGSRIHLTEWLNRAPIVLFFYPKDDSTVSIAEVSDVAKNFSGFRDLRATVLGISYDSVRTHQKFIKKYHLPFLLLSDLFHAVAKSYGTDGLLTPSQETFIIDKHGTIVYINRDVNPATQSLELQNTLQQM